MNNSLVSLLFSVQGRINRAKYWVAMIAYLSLTIAVAGLAIFFNFNTLVLVIAGLIAFAMLVSGCIVGMKRLHDRNKSGWWSVVFYVLPGVLSGLSKNFESGQGAIFSLAGAAVGIWAFIELGCLAGTPGGNRFGADPLGRSDDDSPETDRAWSGHSPTQAR